MIKIDSILVSSDSQLTWASSGHLGQKLQALATLFTNDASWELQALSAAIKARLAPLTQQATAQAVSEFLKDAAVVLSNLGQQCVRACCRSASELSALEAELQSAVKGWRHTEAGRSRLQEAFSHASQTLLRPPGHFKGYPAANQWK